MAVAPFAIPCEGVFGGLAHCCSAHGAAERPGYKTAPGEDDEGDKGDSGADTNEDCSFR